MPVFSSMFFYKVCRTALIILFPYLMYAQQAAQVRLLPAASAAMRFPAKINNALHMDFSLATYEKCKEAIVTALGTQLADTIYQSLQNKDYPEGMDDYKFRYKYSESIRWYQKGTGYICSRLCLLERGYTSLMKVEAVSNKEVKKAIRPKKDFYFFISSNDLDVERDYSNTAIAFGTRARILGTGIGTALNNPFSSEYYIKELYTALNFLDTPAIQRIVARSSPAAMPAGIATFRNYEYTKYKGSNYNGYALGVVNRKVLMCIPANENYHITSLCLRPYDDIYLLLDANEVELDDGTGSIAVSSSAYPFDCDQLVEKIRPVSVSSGKPLRTVTKVLKNQRAACPVCLGEGKVWYANGVRREYLNMTYEKLVQQYNSKRCNYCFGKGFLYLPDATVQVYEE